MKHTSLCPIRTRWGAMQLPLNHHLYILQANVHSLSGRLMRITSRSSRAPSPQPVQRAPLLLRLMFGQVSRRGPAEVAEMTRSFLRFE